MKATLGMIEEAVMKVADLCYKPKTEMAPCHSLTAGLAMGTLHRVKQNGDPTVEDFVVELTKDCTFGEGVSKAVLEVVEAVEGRNLSVLAAGVNPTAKAIAIRVLAEGPGSVVRRVRME